MGRGRFLWEVAVAVLLVSAILCSNKCEAAAMGVARGGSYGGNMALELMMVGSQVDIFPLLPRFRDFEGDKVITDQTSNQNASSCNNGAGNQNGACGGTASNTQDCNKYANNGPCPA